MSFQWNREAKLFGLAVLCVWVSGVPTRAAEPLPRPPAGLRIDCLLDNDAVFRLFSVPAGFWAGFLWRGTREGSGYECVWSRSSAPLCELRCDHLDVSQTEALRLPEAAFRGELSGFFEVEFGSEKMPLCRIVPARSRVGDGASR